VAPTTKGLKEKTGKKKKGPYPGTKTQVVFKIRNNEGGKMGAEALGGGGLKRFLVKPSRIEGKTSFVVGFGVTKNTKEK